MARETKAQREARETEERQARWDEFRAEYPVRFTKALYEFGHLNGNFSVSVVDDNRYQFQSEYVTAALPVMLPLEQDWNYVYALERLESEIQNYYYELEEQQRQYRVKQAALNKLTKEEKDLLGL